MSPFNNWTSPSNNWISDMELPELNLPNDYSSILLNDTLLSFNDTANGTQFINGWGDSIYPSGYRTIEIATIAVIVSIAMIVVVVGNMLVIIAIATEKSLKHITNWFIASLAVADLLLGLVIMPFSLANLLMGYWVFGETWCELHAAIDVLLSTASINNICLISLDRYWSITHAVNYLKHRTPGKAAVMIVFVWVLSGLVSIPPLLGWKVARPSEEFPKCTVSDELGYVLYSACGSFYIPSCIMIFVYIRIYYAAKARARRGVSKKKKKTKKSKSCFHFKKCKERSKLEKRSTQSASNLTLTNVNIKPLAEHGTHTTCFTANAQICSNPDTNKKMKKIDSKQFEENDEIDDQDLIKESNPDLTQNDKIKFDKVNHNCRGENGIYLKSQTTVKHESSLTLPQNPKTSDPSNSGLCVSPAPLRRATTPAPSLDGDQISDMDPSSSDSGALTRCSVIKPLKLRFCQPILGKKLTKPKRELIDMGRVTPHYMLDPEKEKKRIARKKEKRATLILGLIMGSFIACWFPFFFMYILVPLCPACYIPGYAFDLAFWLGYMNSAFNPVIYTIFNKDFRKAFRKILFK